MIDLCQWFGKVMKKYIRTKFFCVFLMASVIRALITKKMQASIWL